MRASQTLQRGLDILDLVACGGPIGLREIGESMKLTRSTAHRLTAALVDRDLVRNTPYGYQLGPKLLVLAETARLQRPLTALARPHLEALARDHLDAVNLAIRDRDRVRYMDQIRGARRMTVRSVVGELRPMATTALGRALLLDDAENGWRRAYEADLDAPCDENAQIAWIERMREFRDLGAAFDIEENEDRVRCVAAPVRDSGGRIVAAISISSLPQYLDDNRMAQLVRPVTETANAIARELGWTARSIDRRTRRPHAQPAD
ncbi:IclR family transcriptional regulator [Caulobacter sp. BK020]|uniref:IclR family transcriptional regulator n=1 Tax=Caulobacter sp. BK020 TaxID=2512117 RepID=UPI0010CEDBF7|nr:IclR family transcriptional regulator [Caulobacter sp. BK020]TCS14927.1 IclR family transcriptional regulator [Caulobacter sp. BK020]